MPPLPSTSDLLVPRPETVPPMGNVFAGVVVQATATLLTAAVVTVPVPFVTTQVCAGGLVLTVTA